MKQSDATKQIHDANAKKKFKGAYKYLKNEVAPMLEKESSIHWIIIQLLK